MCAAAIISLEEYLASIYHPDSDYVDGQLLERNVGLRFHSSTQTEATFWFGVQADQLRLQPFVEMRLQVAPRRFRIPDLLLVDLPVPDEQVFTTAPYLCLEVVSPDDTMSDLQDRLDDYLRLGVPNIWVIDPWKSRACTVTETGWHTALEGLLRTVDGRIALPLSEILPEGSAQS